MGGGLLGLSAAPWIKATVDMPTGAEEIYSSGSQAAPIVPALGLVLLAAALVLALARQVGVIIASVIIGGTGIGIAWASVAVLKEPKDAMASKVAEVTGAILPPEAMHDVTATWAPFTGIVAAIIGILLAFAVLRSSKSWTRDRRHERQESVVESTQAFQEMNDAELWDELSAGHDPTSPPNSGSLPLNQEDQNDV